MGSTEPGSSTAPAGRANDNQVPSKPEGKRQALPWLGGAILILVGVVLLVGQLTQFQLQNWWALFIFIPAFGSLANAWSELKYYKQLTSSARGSLVAGIFLTCLALIFLLQLDLGRWWPLLVIVAGVAMLLAAVGREKSNP